MVVTFDRQSLESPGLEAIPGKGSFIAADFKTEAELVSEGINQGVSTFAPESVLKNLFQNYSLAEKLYGKTVLRLLTGYSSNYVKRNINIPEFREAVKRNVSEKVEELKKKGFLDNDFSITREGVKLASLLLYMEEVERLNLKGVGRKRSKERDPYGDRDSVKQYSKERYRDLAVKPSIRMAVRRGHSSVLESDLRAYTRQKKGRVSVIYALDASGSMKGEKLGTAKRAGVALAYQAVNEKNLAGLLVFGSEIKEEVPPTTDFQLLLESITRVRAGMETDIALTIRRAAELFPKRHSKHLIILSDALPTKGEDPSKDTLKAAAEAAEEGVTISLVGINLNGEGLSLARKLVELGRGVLYRVTKLEDLDVVVLEDYFAFS